jgi:alpha-L-fucosidase
MKAQLTELLTNYGEIAGIWFDGHWDQKEWDGKHFGKLQVDWHYDEIYKLIHDLQPQCLIGNNHHIAPIEGEDFQMFERDLPGHNTTGWGTDASDVGQLPKEVCETINGSWGFNLQDGKHKSEKEIIHYIVRSAGYGSNLLLNVGPMPNGKIQTEHIASLKKVGIWMKENGETIYKTTEGPIVPNDEMAFTRKGKKVYLHILDDSKETFFVEGFNGKVKSMQYYKSNENVNYEITKYGMFVEVPKEKKDGIDTIIEIILK